MSTILAKQEQHKSLMFDIANMVNQSKEIAPSPQESPKPASELQQLLAAIQQIQKIKPPTKHKTKMVHILALLTTNTNG